MVRNKEKKDKIVEAHPVVTFLSDIEIMDEKHSITIGGFCIDGFYLKHPYELVKEEKKNIIREDMTYYRFVKSSKKMGEYEKVIRKKIKEKENRKKNRKKELEKELDNLNKDIKKDNPKILKFVKRGQSEVTDGN